MKKLLGRLQTKYWKLPLWAWASIAGGAGWAFLRMRGEQAEEVADAGAGLPDPVYVGGPSEDTGDLGGGGTTAVGAETQSALAAQLAGLEDSLSELYSQSAGSASDYGGDYGGGGSVDVVDPSAEPAPAAPATPAAEQPKPKPGKRPPRPKGKGWFWNPKARAWERGYITGTPTARPRGKGWVWNSATQRWEKYSGQRTIVGKPAKPSRPRAKPKRGGGKAGARSRKPPRPAPPKARPRSKPAPARGRRPPTPKRATKPKAKKRARKPPRRPTVRGRGRGD